MDYKIIYELLKEVRKSQQEQGEKIVKQGVSLENVEKLLDDLKKITDENTENVAYHIHRTDLLEREHSKVMDVLNSVCKRVDVLEEPIKAKAWFKRKYVSIISVVTAILSLIALVSRILGMW